MFESFFNPDLEAAERIIAENAHKPIRQVGPADYSAGQVAKPVRKEGVKAKAERKRAELAIECAKYLREHGKCLTAQLSRATGATHQAVAYACEEVPGIRSEATVVKTSRTKIWWIVGSSINSNKDKSNAV
jgi:hypothetical protein